MIAKLSGMSIAAQPLLERCPVCVYRLEGLPVQTRCPECGLKLDRRWQVFGGRLLFARGRRRRILWIAGATIFVGVFFATFIAGRVRWDGLGPAVSTALIGFVILRPPRGFIAVGPIGIVSEIVDKGRRTFQWPRLIKAHHDVVHNCIRLHFHGDSNAQLETFTYFRNNTRAIEECVNALNAGRERWTANAPEASEECASEITHD